MTATSTAPPSAAARAPGADAEPRLTGFAGALLRPDDQLRLTFQLVNGTVDPATNRIEPLVEEEGIFYVVSFGSQHTTEDTVSITETPPDAPLAHRRAQPTRVSVEIPAGTELTVGNLLDLAAYALHVDPRADGAELDPGDERIEPAADVTAIEIPATLILSPPGSQAPTARFVAPPAPITHGDVTELWRARLSTSGGDSAAQPTVRAIARRSGAGFPDDDLDLVVDQSTGANGVPLQVAELSLSSQGADIDVSGAWATGPLAAYRHRAVRGRDLHVEVVARGHLAPFGHVASLTTLTERTLRVDESGDLTASLVEDTYLSVAEPTIDYDEDLTSLLPHAGRQLPFTSITAADHGSGPVDRERLTLPNGSAIKVDKACVLTRDGQDVTISYTATDRTGQGGITFQLPAVFVDESEAYEANDSVGGRKTVLAKLRTWYAQSASDSRRDLQLGGQPVGWAEPSVRGAAGSVQTTNRIRLGLVRPEIGGVDPDDVSATLEALGRPAFYPAVTTAWIVDVASTTALGGDPPELEVTVADRWLEHGAGPDNVDLGYLDLAVPDLVVPTTDALGMLAASLNVGTLGQFLGGGLKFPDGDWSWDVTRALGDIGGGLPKLLGSLDLADLIAPIDLAGLDVPDGLPALRVEPQFGNPDVPQLPTGACFHFTWEPALGSFPKDSDKPTFLAGPDTHALLALTACVPQNTTTFTAALERFTLQLPPEVPVVAIDFAYVTYRNDNGSSAVDADVTDWRFIGALNWLEPLKDFLAGLLDGGAPTFDGGIFIDSDLPIPGFSIGVLGVSGLRVELGLDLPDSGASSVALAVGRRDDPFRITIMGFGGDGSFGLEVDATDIVLIEASLAVTYELGVDVFIANASLSASVGMFVVYELNERSGRKEVTLGAYAELRGSVSVFGLVELSGAVTVALTYNVTTKVLRGVAAVTGEVSSIFGKNEVTHDVEVEIAMGGGSSAARLTGVHALAAPGDDADPGDLSFADRFSRPQWTVYCAAFAA
jgi:hypothetical protein